jgi:hypothetical protein
LKVDEWSVIRICAGSTYQCPEWHISNLAASTSDSERKDEDHDLGTSIESSGQEEVVLPEPPRSELAQVVLREYGQHKGGENRAVDSNAQVADSPYVPCFRQHKSRRKEVCRMKRTAKNWRDDLVSLGFGPLLVDEPEWDGNCKADKDGKRNNLIGKSEIDISGNRPTTLSNQLTA